MKKRKKLLLLIIIVLLLFNTTVFADNGDMGYFGGISEGVNLPYTMDKYVDNKIKRQTTFDYREVTFLSGKPIECKGEITVTRKDIDFEKSPSGSYTETFTVNASNIDEQAQINRTITFTTSYRVKEGDFKRQIIRSSQLTRWNESITVGGETYTLNERSSTYSKSSIEDLTPGVSYYDTTISYNAHYLLNEANSEVISMVEGNIYGYNQPWSKVETQNINMQISRDGGNTIEMAIRIRPFFEAKKTLYYDETDPFPISFGGTYNQRLEREAVLNYEILSSKEYLTENQKKGSFLISPANEIEKLPIPENLDFISGHWAEEDLKRMYSMEIFTETPVKGMQFSAMNRGEFVKALCLAMDISTEKYEKTTRRSPQIFGDVPTSHPLYKYIMAAYDAKLIKGVGIQFDIDKPITRQEAFVIYIRVIGLERLGVTDSPQTPFLDDNVIAPWAKKEIMAGFNLGIIKGNSDGKLLPTNWITKAEAASIVNRLVEYLRNDISRDYRRL